MKSFKQIVPFWSNELEGFEALSYEGIQNIEQWSTCVVAEAYKEQFKRNVPYNKEDSDEYCSDCISYAANFSAAVDSDTGEIVQSLLEDTIEGFTEHWNAIHE